MFEIARYLLALLVAQTHLWPLPIYWTSWQAVFGFYTLSGYLITRVLQRRYGFAFTGTAAFLMNRVLRLWPAYLVVVILTSLMLRLYPLWHFSESLTEPKTFMDRLTTFTILGQTGFDFGFRAHSPRLAVQSWSLSIEVFCYCLLAFYFGKTPRRLLTLAILGLIGISISSTHCWLYPPHYPPYCLQNRYWVLQAGFIPFALGGLTYFYRPAIRDALFAYWRWAIAATLAGEVLCAFNLFAATTLGPYLGAAMMVALIAWDGGDKRPSAATDFIGRASYHLFIAHMSIAAVLVVGLAQTSGSFTVLALTVLISSVLSAMLVPLEWWLNGLRDHVSRWARKSATSPGPAGSDRVTAPGDVT